MFIYAGQAHLNNLFRHTIGVGATMIDNSKSHSPQPEALLADLQLPKASLPAGSLRRVFFATTYYWRREQSIHLEMLDRCYISFHPLVWWTILFTINSGPRSFHGPLWERGEMKTVMQGLSAKERAKATRPGGEHSSFPWRYSGASATKIQAICLKKLSAGLRRLKDGELMRIYLLSGRGGSVRDIIFKELKRRLDRASFKRIHGLHTWLLPYFSFHVRNGEYFLAQNPRDDKLANTLVDLLKKKARTTKELHAYYLINPAAHHEMVVEKLCLKIRSRPS